MKKFFGMTLCSVMLAFNVSAGEGISPEKQKLIDNLLEQTGQSSAAVGQQMSQAFVQQMANVLRQTNPDIDPKAFDILQEEVNALISEEMDANGGLMKLMYPIYDRHFTSAELKQMIEFNQTDLGKKLIKVLPMITQQGMQAGQQFGQQLAPKIQQRIVARFQKEGIKIQ